MLTVGLLSAVCSRVCRVQDGDGSISAKELEIVMKALGESIDRQTIDLMIESVDTDKSGFIDFEEFRQMMRDGPDQQKATAKE